MSAERGEEARALTLTLRLRSRQTTAGWGQQGDEDVEDGEGEKR